MGLEQHESVGTLVVVLDQIEQVRHVADRLRHLLALSIDDERVMHPMVGEGFAERHGLRPLVLVMRKTQVLATAMQVEALTEQVEAHDDAFAVPARSARSPW